MITNVAGVPGAGGAQTPWSSDINAAAYSLTNFGSLVFGPGPTNVLKRSGTGLSFTNGSSLPIFFDVQGPLGTAHFGETAGSAIVEADSGLNVWLSPNAGASGHIVVNSTSIAPDRDDVFYVGTAASNGAFHDSYFKGTQHAVGFNDGTGNYSWLALSHQGTNDGNTILFNTQAAGTAGTPRDFQFTNGVVHLDSTKGIELGGTTITTWPGGSGASVWTNSWDLATYPANSYQLVDTNGVIVMNNEPGIPAFAFQRRQFTIYTTNALPMAGDDLINFNAGGVGVYVEVDRTGTYSDPPQVGEAAAGVFANTSTAATSYGIIGIGAADALPGQTNVGVVGICLDDVGNPYQNTAVGAYFSTPRDVYTHSLESAVLLLDAFDSPYPLIVGRTNNGTHVFEVANDGSITTAGNASVAGTNFNGYVVTTNSMTVGSTIKAGANLLETPELYTGSFKLYRGALTPIDAGVSLDFSSTNRYWSISLTGNVTFATANLVAGKHANLMITGVATNATYTWPANWVWIGYKPSYLTATKHADLYLKSTGTTDAGVWVYYGEEQ